MRVNGLEDQTNSGFKRGRHHAYLVLIVIALLMLSLVPREERKRLDANKASVLNSQYVEAFADRSTAWAIIQARFSAPLVATGGFCGTAWVIERSKERVVFVTSSHVTQDALFLPRETGVTDVRVWLANGTMSIPLSCERRVVAANDITFLVFPTSILPIGEDILVPRLGSACLSKGMNVYNLGYPDRGHAGNQLGIDLWTNTVSFAYGPWRQTGHVSDEVVADLRASDVTLQHAHALVLDYTSEPGFSGGPVVTADDQKIVGMMSAVLPNGSAAPISAIAVSVKEILAQKKRVLSSRCP